MSAKRNHTTEAAGLMPVEMFLLMAAAFYPLTHCPGAGWRAYRHPHWGEITAWPIFPDAITSGLWSKGLLGEASRLNPDMVTEHFCIGRGEADGGSYDRASFLAPTEQGLRALGSYSDALLAEALDFNSDAVVGHLRERWGQTGIEALAQFRQGVSPRSHARRGTRRLARSSRRRRSRGARSVPTGRSRRPDRRSAPSNRRAGPTRAR